MVKEEGGCRGFYRAEDLLKSSYRLKSELAGRSPAAGQE